MKELTRSIDTDLDEERPSRLSIGGRVAGTVGLIMACVTLGGCDQLLEVDLPGEVEGEDLEGPGSIELLVTSAVGAFECAFTNYMVLSANTSDELTVAGSFSNFFPYDQRDIQPNEPVNYAESTCDDEGALFTPVNQARAIADDAIRRLIEFSEEQVPNKDELLARAAVYSGFTKVIMGEGFCRSAFDGGPELSREEVMDSAVAAFTLGIDAAERAGADDLRILSYLGRARARIYLGDKSAAAADAREVPEGFEMFVTRSATALERENKMYRLNLQEGRTSVEPPFRTAGERPFQTITWKGVEDPRVRIEDAGRAGNDALTPLVFQTKYEGLSDPIPFARYEEALLIIAEAEGGQTAVEIINRLHDEAGLPPFDPSADAGEPLDHGDPVTNDPIMDHLIQERGRELFLEGHRLGDALRFGLPFKTGVQPYTDRPYRDQTCYPLPTVEIENNPNISS